jgi:hypothetical protein
MKRIIFSVLSLCLTCMIFTSCDETYTDLMTSDVKTGGLVDPSSSIAYKLGMTPSLDIVLNVPKGPGIQSIRIDKSYTRMSDTTTSNVVSTTIDINGANETGDVEKLIPQTWDSMKEGLTLPTDPQIPANENVANIADFIGDYWEFRYTTTMTDGRVLENTRTTKVAIANFFAGSYDLLVKYFHPTAGGSYPTAPYGGDRKSKIDMVPVGALDCQVFFGVWEDNIINIHIASDYTVTLTFDRPDAIQGDPYNPNNVCSYDPETGIIKLYYYYPGSGGPRVFWAVYTPKN